MSELNNWRTTDEEEIERRKLRAAHEEMRVRNLTPEHPVFSNFAVESANSGQSYRVEIRQIKPLQCSCTCVDFRVNGLGTCKHVERVLHQLRQQFDDLFLTKSTRIDLVPDPATGRLAIERNIQDLPQPLRTLFDITGVAFEEFSNEEILADFEQSESPQIRISQDVDPWLERRQLEQERVRLRRDYERNVRSGLYPVQETKVPLLPYQREGMLHLAFTERAILADEMGLGKTAQAIAAATLLHRLGKVNRVLVVAPASLKTEWEEQIRLFTDLPYQLVFGDAEMRRAAYENAPFFTLANYEQVLRDEDDLNALLRPDCVILDEAQRIKNWSSKTAQAVKHLHGRYAFVLTGTPVENRIDDIYSLMSIIDPQVLGPLFRFNREYYELNAAGQPVGYKNLSRLRKVLSPYILRRRKEEVEKELPERSEHIVFVSMDAAQRTAYGAHEQRVAQLLGTMRTRPLGKVESDILQQELAMMRMICDTPFILDEQNRVCPKLDELRHLMESVLSAPDCKVLVFSEWEKMLQLVRELCDTEGWQYVWHTGSVPQQKRGEEIRRFKNDETCRIFLSTDTGGQGLNLQQASVVINCDLPWSPARLEQRIARVWRKHQVRNVTVINLVSEDTIESRMMEVLARKRELAQGVLDENSTIDEQKLVGSRQAFLKQVSELVVVPPPHSAQQSLPEIDSLRTTDPELGFAAVLSQQVGDKLVACEYYQPERANPVLLVVTSGKENKRTVDACAERIRADWFGACRGERAPIVETISQDAYEAMKRLVTTGVLFPARTTGRTLFLREIGLGKPKLKPESDRERVQTFRRKAAMAYRQARRCLTSLAFDDAREPLCETITLLAKAWAIEKKQPEPQTARDALSDRFASLWTESLEILREILQPESDPVSVARILTPFFGG
ncbi:MAG: DEAD/DEAH box helicase [Kiritimatiellae bacterium]|nr:DEAD/DEAH box helicase [Kiritimatiellia bacterium]